jgi:hypothetical protein
LILPIFSMDKKNTSSYLYILRIKETIPCKLPEHG